MRGDEYYPGYRNHLAFAWQTLQFRRATTGGSLVVAAGGVPAASVKRLETTNGRLFAALTISLVDTVTDWVRQETRVTQWPAIELKPDAWLLTGVSTDAPPGQNVVVRITLQNDS